MLQAEMMLACFCPITRTNHRVLFEGPKPTFIYSNYKWISELQMALPTNKEWSTDITTKCLDALLRALEVILAVLLVRMFFS